MELDANRQQAEKKVLRGRDIIPSSNPESNHGNSSQSQDVEMTEIAVPQFDLAAEIMAQQRKVTAARRKKPAIRPQKAQEMVKAKFSETPVRPVQSRIQAQYPAIAEIVARDIQIMLRAYGRKLA